MSQTSLIKTKWVVFTAVSDKGFNRNYQTTFKKNGFKSIGGSDCFAMWFNESSPASVERMNKAVSSVRAKIASYKHFQGVLAFTITDKQFGLIGKNKIKMSCDVPVKIGVIPVTYEQMYRSGKVTVKGGQ